MKKILSFILITSYALFADALPQSIKTTVKALSNNTLQLSSNIPVGMSGIVIHNYGNGLTAITHAAISRGNGQATIQDYTVMEHENIPSIKTAVQAGDTAIFGSFYDNALVIAPNQNSYNKITKSFNKTWTHPDVFALEFMKTGETTLSLDNLEKFAKRNQIGLVLIVLQNKVLILDPISKQTLGALNIQTNIENAMSPFYARFDQMDVSTFGFSNKNYTPYLQSVAGLQ